MSDLPAVRMSTAMLYQDERALQVHRDLATQMFVGGVSSGLLRDCFKNQSQVQSAMLVLIGMGEDPIAGLQHMHPLPGNKIGMDYKFLMGVVERNAPQFRWAVEEERPGFIKGWFQASEAHPKYHLTYTIEQARKSGLVKPNSAWDKHEDDMIFKTWWLKGSRRVAPAAHRGVPIQYDVEQEDDDAAMVASPAPALESPAPAVSTQVPPAAPTDAPSSAPVDYKAEFLALATKLHFKVKEKGKVKMLLEELLTEGGVKPVIKNADEVTMADWRIAGQRLAAKYESKAEVVETAGNGGGTTLPPQAESESAPAVEADDPPPAEDDLEAPETESGSSDPDGEAARVAQLQDPTYLLSLGQSLELAWKAPPGSVVKEAPPKSGKWWFVHRPTLLQFGFKNADGSAQTKALFQSTRAESNLEPRQVQMLSEAVIAELDKSKNGGRTAVSIPTERMR